MSSTNYIRKCGDVCKKIRKKKVIALRKENKKEMLWDVIRLLTMAQTLQCDINRFGGWIEIVRVVTICSWCFLWR